jgi:hypothetical protein
MSLSLKAVDRLFERMALTYGKQFADMYSNVDPSSVKTLWAYELAAYENSLHRIAWALENLPPRCPNVIEFKQLCRQAPAPEAPALPEPKADPERLKQELSKLGDLKAKLATDSRVDHKAWAKRIMARHASKERINPTSLRFAREALKGQE